MEMAKKLMVGKIIAMNRLTPVHQIQTRTVVNQRIAPNLNFDYNEVNVKHNRTQSRRPLVLLMSWLRAKEEHLAPYRDLYMKKGFDVLTAKITEYDLFYPVDTGQLCLAVLKNELAQYDHIIVHAFSSGVYVLATMLLEQNKKDDKFAKDLFFNNRIKAVVLDSVVTVDLILGPTHSFHNLPAIQKYFIKCCQMFLKLHKSTSNYLLNANKIIYNSPLKVPALVMVSDSDPFGNVSKSEQIVNIWRNKDINVIYQRWTNGKHVQLMKYNPIEYGQLIDQLIDKTQIFNCLNQIKPINS